MLRLLKQLRPRRILLLSLALCVPIWLARGCAFMTPEKAENPPPISPPETQLQITVYNHPGGHTLVLPLEDYIVGVVAAEMPASFEAEALKAQAVAARTYTLRKLAAFGGSPCGLGGADICTDSGHCQAYASETDRRKKWGGSFDKNEARVSAAVYATAGETIVYDGKVIEAFFHSTSGGRTEASENVFSQALPYLRSVESTGEEVAPRFERSVSVSRKEFCARVNESYPTAKLKPSTLEKNVRIQSRFEGGRVKALKLGKATITGRELRKLFELDSANFTFEYTKQNVVIRTKGFGHGVGMSQYGANAMAKDGAGYREILAHYYVGTQIEQLKQ